MRKKSKHDQSNLDAFVEWCQESWLEQHLPKVSAETLELVGRGGHTLCHHSHACWPLLTGLSDTCAQSGHCAVHVGRA
jgi:hypothetical protein